MYVETHILLDNTIYEINLNKLLLNWIVLYAYALKSERKLFMSYSCRGQLIRGQKEAFIPHSNLFNLSEGSL